MMNRERSDQYELDTILKGIKEKGFEIVPISQLIHRENFEMDHEGRQIPKGKDV